MFMVVLSFAISLSKVCVVFVLFCCCRLSISASFRQCFRFVLSFFCLTGRRNLFLIYFDVLFLFYFFVSHIYQEALFSLSCFVFSFRFISFCFFSRLYNTRSWFSCATCTGKTPDFSRNFPGSSCRPCCASSRRPFRPPRPFA